MSERVLQVPFPIDDEGYFRRECPYCCRQFKVLLDKDEMRDMISKLEASYLLDESSEHKTGEDREQEALFTCPYCGQEEDGDSWWTQEQLLYIRTHLENIVADMVNEQFIRPLKREYGRKTSGPVSIRFEGKEMEKKKAWMSPEASDMGISDLPCCGRKVKIEPEWSETVYCFFCGFPHARGRAVQALEDLEDPEQ